MRGEKSRLGNEAVDVALYQITDRSMAEEEVDIDISMKKGSSRCQPIVAKPASRKEGNRFLTRHDMNREARTCPYWENHRL